MKLLYLKTVFIVALLFISQPLLGQESKQVLKFLGSHDWDTASMAIDLINQGIDTLGTNPEIRRALVKLFHRETQYLRDSSTHSMAKLTHETEGDAAFLVVKIDLVESLPDLLDWAGNSPVFRSYLAKNMLSDCNKNQLVDSLISRLNKSEPFFDARKSAYFEVACMVLESTKEECSVLHQHTKDLLQKYLISEDRFDRLAAVKCSCSMTRDTAVKSMIKHISESDSYVRKKNGAMIYPIREAAKAILEGKQK